MKIIRAHEDIAAGLAALSSADPRLHRVIAVAGAVPLRRSEPGFAGISSIIVSQMISKASAAAIWGRMEAHFGTVEAGRFLEASDAACRAFGLSGAKIRALRGVALAVCDGRLDLEAVCHREGPAAIDTLCALPGIGRWTAEVYLVVCAGHPDVFPVGDVALQSAVATAFALSARPTAPELDAASRVWSPWRSVAARLFWAYYAARMRRDAAPVVP